MNLASIILLIALGICFIAALIYTIRKPGCGSDCRNCSHYGNCRKKN